MKKWTKILLFCLGSLSLISWDRASKDLAKEHLKHQAPVSYFHDTFRLEYVENTGAAMSMGDQLSKTTSFWLLSILPLAVLVGAFVYTISKAKELSFAKMLAIALIFAGGAGNIIDRLLYDRHVTDFMNLGINHARTAIFNFADVYIIIGVLLLVVFLRGRKQQLAA